jgi:putative membrane protein
MLLLLARLILSLLANAVGLLAAAYFLDGFSIDTLSFISVVVILSLIITILSPLITKIAFTSAPYLMGGIALISTLVGLIITNIISDGLTITGLSTWVLASLVIWVFSIIASVVLPLFIFKKTLKARKEAKS